jgi:hypothetical protein
MARVKLRGFKAIDRRTAAARETLAFRSELVMALGGEADLSPQKKRLVDMAARASLLLDHVDAWLFAQQSLINARNKTLLPVLIQRQALAEHLARLLEKLGLERAPQKVPDLATYLAQRHASRTPSDDSETPPGGALADSDPHERSGASRSQTPMPPREERT